MLSDRLLCRCYTVEHRYYHPQPIAFLALPVSPDSVLLYTIDGIPVRYTSLDTLDRLCDTKGFTLYPPVDVNYTADDARAFSALERIEQEDRERKRRQDIQACLDKLKTLLG